MLIIGPRAYFYPQQWLIRFLIPIPSLSAPEDLSTKCQDSFRLVKDIHD